MSTIGLYFKRTKPDTNALRTRLNAIAAALGYTAERGPTAGQGNLAEMLEAIDAGKVALVLLDEEQRGYVIDYLREITSREGAAMFQDLAITEALQVIANSLEQAANRSTIT